MCWKKDTHRCGRIKVLIVGFSFFQECVSLKEMINEAGVNAAGVLREGWLWSPRALLVQVWCAGQQPPECRLSGPSSDLPNPNLHFALGFMRLEKRFPTQLWLTALTERGFCQGQEAPLDILRAPVLSEHFSFLLPWSSGFVPACLSGVDSWAKTHWHDPVCLRGEVKITFPGLLGIRRLWSP